MDPWSGEVQWIQGLGRSSGSRVGRGGQVDPGSKSPGWILARYNNGLQGHKVEQTEPALRENKGQKTILRSSSFNRLFKSVGKASSVDLIRQRVENF